MIIKLNEKINIIHMFSLNNRIKMRKKLKKTNLLFKMGVKLENNLLLSALPKARENPENG